MKSKENNLEKNISRLVKLTGDSNEPSEAFADSVVKNALDELKGAKAGRKREGSDKFIKAGWPKIFAYAASIIIVCGVVVALTVPGLKLARDEKVSESQIGKKGLADEATRTFALPSDASKKVAVRGQKAYKYDKTNYTEAASVPVTSTGQAKSSVERRESKVSGSGISTESPVTQADAKVLPPVEVVAAAKQHTEPSVGLDVGSIRVVGKLENEKKSPVPILGDKGIKSRPPGSAKRVYKDAAYKFDVYAKAKKEEVGGPEATLKSIRRSVAPTQPVVCRPPGITSMISDKEYTAIVEAIRVAVPFVGCPVGLPERPLPHEVLISYSERTGVPMAKIEAVMIDIVRKHWKLQGSDPDSISQHSLARRVIGVLGELRTQKALPVLHQVVESDNQDIRVTAMRAIIKIGGENLLPFVRHVFCDRKRFSWYERFLMYEQLSSYIGLQTWRPAPLEDKESFKVDEDLRAGVLQFLINAVYADITSSGNTQRLDKMLCLVSEDYKFSYERENVLNRLEQAWTKIERQAASEWARAYPTEQLKILRALPVERRTHVEIQEIKSNTWPLLIEKAVEPSASLVTMTPLGVMFEFKPLAGSSGAIDMELYEHGGEMMVAFSCPHSGEPIQIWLAEPVDQNDPAKYYLRYRIRITAAPSPKWRVVGVSRMPRTTNKTSDSDSGQTQQKPSEPKNVSTSEESPIAGLLPYGEVKDGLSAFLLCHRERFKVGQPIPLTYGIINVGSGLEWETNLQKAEEHSKLKTRVWWLRNNPELRYNYSWFEVTGPGGKNVPYHGSTGTLRNLTTAQVDKFSVVLYHRQFVGSHYPDLRGPLASDPKHLRQYFDLSRPGNYKVRWGYNPWWKVGPWTGTLMSNEVQIEVVK